MNQETNDFLKENLEEAHNTFIYVIEKMKEKNISFQYNVVESMEMNSYQEVSEKIRKMSYYVLESKELMEDNHELFENEHGFYIKYISLYIVSLLLIKIYHEVFDTHELSDILKYAVGMFLGSVYMGLLNDDINNNRSDTKEKRDLINKLKTMKEEYKEIHNQAVQEIDSIFALNSVLWTKIGYDKEKIVPVLKKVL